MMGSPREPEPPQNVQVVLLDGRRIPVECVYRGWRDGRHEWGAVSPLGVPLAYVAAVTMDVLPAKTRVELVARASLLGPPERYRR